MVYDESENLLNTPDTVTKEDGSFSITLPLPESFTVVIESGWLGEELFEHEVKRYIPNFKTEEIYKINVKIVHKPK